MGKSDKTNISIRFATEHDIPAVMKFIDTHWKQGHILGNNEQLFRYEWLRNGKVSIAVAMDGDEIVGMEGYIPYGDKHRDIMMTLWKVTKTGNPLLGMAILDFIRNNADVRTISSPGINAKTVELYEYLGYETGTMTQWYRLNPQNKDFRIAIIRDDSCPQIHDMWMDMRFVKYDNFSMLERDFCFKKYYATEPIPFKEAWYIEHRYFQHPVYHYDVYGGGLTGQKADILLVFRTQECQGTKALRLVDVIGNTDMLYQVTPFIDNLLSEQKAEYVDIYEKGMDNKSMREAGWLTVADSGNIIPNYFSPFVQENVDIRYFTSEPRIKLFKADGDQDRPS